MKTPNMTVSLTVKCTFFTPCQSKRKHIGISFLAHIKFNVRRIKKGFRHLFLTTTMILFISETRPWDTFHLLINCAANVTSHSSHIFNNKSV